MNRGFTAADSPIGRLVAIETAETAQFDFDRAAGPSASRPLALQQTHLHRPAIPAKIAFFQLFDAC